MGNVDGPNPLTRSEPGTINIADRLWVLMLELILDMIRLMTIFIWVTTIHNI
jgi:hypothetical protein